MDFFDINNKIKVVPNFIDIDKYVKQQELCVSENHEFGDDLIITHVSNFRPVKNVKNVIWFLITS